MQTSAEYDSVPVRPSSPAQGDPSPGIEHKSDVPASIRVLDMAYAEAIDLYEVIAKETSHIHRSVNEATGTDYFSLHLTRQLHRDFSDEHIRFAEEVVRLFKRDVATVDAPLETTGHAAAEQYRERYRKLCRRPKVTSEEVKQFWLSCPPSRLWRDLLQSYQPAVQRERTAVDAARTMISYFHLKENKNVKRIRGKVELRINVWTREKYGQVDGRVFDGIPCERLMPALLVFAAHHPELTAWVYDLDSELSTYVYGRRQVVSRHKTSLAQEVELITYYENLRLLLPDEVVTPLQLFIGRYGQTALTE